jgi:hypothetical protein
LRPRRFWPRFTLRVLLAAITVLCIGMAWWTQRARQQKQIVDQIRLSGGRVTYDFEAENTTTLIASQLPMHEVQLIDFDFGDSEIVENESSVPHWLLDRLGVDFFHTVIQADVVDCDELRKIDSLGYLQELSVGGGANDQDIRHVARSRRLKRFLLFSDGKLTDDSLALLAKMPSLEIIHLDGEFSGAGLAALARSRSLREVTVYGCRDDVDHDIVEVFRSEGRVESLWLYHEGARTAFWSVMGHDRLPQSRPALGYAK